LGCFEERSHIEDMNVRFVEDITGVRRSMTKEEALGVVPLEAQAKAYRYNPLPSARSSHSNDVQEYVFEGKVFTPGKRTFSTNCSASDPLH
jgi:hypothetical protein